MLIPSSNVNTTPKSGIFFMTGFLWFFRRFPQINVGGDSAHFPSLEDALVSLASLACKRVGCDNIHQTKYVKELLKKFNMDNAKEMKSPMHPTTDHGLDEESKKVDGILYIAMIGSLLYLSMSKPNIILVCALVQDFRKNQGKSI